LGRTSWFLGVERVFPKCDQKKRCFFEGVPKIHFWKEIRKKLIDYVLFLKTLAHVLALVAFAKKGRGHGQK